MADELVRMIDYEARLAAKEATTLITSHEKLCTDRWEQSRTAMSEAKKSIDRLFMHMWVAAGSIISLLVAVVGWLLTHPGITFGGG